MLETFISMKFDAECNETTPDIVLYRFHEDYELLTKTTSKSPLVQPQTPKECQRLIILSEFNQTDVNRSVCEFYILHIIF